MKKLVVPVTCGLLLVGAQSVLAEAGPFIRAFYPDDVPVVVAALNPRTLALPETAAVPVQTTAGVQTSAGVVAAPVVSPAVIHGTRFVTVNDGYLYRHRAYPNRLLHWSIPLQRWLMRTNRTSTGWAFVTEQWDLDPPRP